MQSTIKEYYELTKPGIIYGNVLTTAAGFLYASKGNVNIVLFLATILGVSMVIASACVFNNILDKDIDKKMKRTRNRAIVKGSISINHARFFGSILGLLGFYILIIFTNLLVVLLGIIAVTSYVLAYTYLKRTTPVATYVGTIPGALSLVAGYVAVVGKIDLAAIFLFLIMVFWQLPHFWAIGIFRLKEYRKAGIPIAPVVSGVEVTKKYILLFTFFYLVTVLGFSLVGLTGVTFFLVMAPLSFYWLWMGIEGLNTQDNEKWAKKVFKFSLIMLLIFSILLSLNVVLP